MINQDSKSLSEFAKDVIVKNYSFENIEEAEEVIEYFRGKITSFLVEMVQVSHEIDIHVINIFTNAIENINSSVRINAIRALVWICRSENVSEERVVAIVKALTKDLSDAGLFVRESAAKALCNIKQADMAFSELVLQDINIGNWLERKKYIAL